MSAACAAMSVATSIVAARRAPLVAGAQVAELGLHPVDRVAPAGSVPVLPSRDRLAREVLRRAGHERARARPSPPTGPRRTGGWSRTGCTGCGSRCGRRRRATSGPASRDGGARRRRRRRRATAQTLVRSKPPANTDVEREQLALVVGQQVVRPRDGVAERELPFRPRRRAPAAAGSDRRVGPEPRPRSWRPCARPPARSPAGARRAVSQISVTAVGGLGAPEARSRAGRRARGRRTA